MGFWAAVGYGPEGSMYSNCIHFGPNVPYRQYFNAYVCIIIYIYIYTHILFGHMDPFFPYRIAGDYVHWRGLLGSHEAFATNVHYDHNY